MYHFTLILLGRIVEPQVKKVNTKLHINSKLFLYQYMQIIRTTILVFIGELFFRANGLKAGIQMFKNMITNFSFKQMTDGTLFNMGIDVKDIRLIAVVIVVIFVISLLKERGIHIREKVATKHIVVRWSLYYALIISIIIFGTYGLGIIPLDPMYANF